MKSLLSIIGIEMNENIVRTMFRFGLGAIFAGVLLGVFIGDVRADQKKNREEHGLIQQRLANIENAMTQFAHSQSRTEYLQLRQCINTAKSLSDRDMCVERPIR